MAGKNSGKLKVTTRGDKEIVLSRVFDAPRHLVWETMTKPELVKRWWCSMPGYTMPVCEIDLRVGGKWRYVMVGTDGEVGFHGEYLELDAPQKIVQTEIFDPFPDELTTCTMTLEEKGGRTHYQTIVVHTTTEGRDAHIASGMEYGAGLAMDALEEIAQSLGTAAGTAAPSGAGTSTAPAPRET